MTTDWDGSDLHPNGDEDDVFADIVSVSAKPAKSMVDGETDGDLIAGDQGSDEAIGGVFGEEAEAHAEAEKPADVRRDRALPRRAAHGRGTANRARARAAWSPVCRVFPAYAHLRARVRFLRTFACLLPAHLCMFPAHLSAHGTADRAP